MNTAKKIWLALVIIIISAACRKAEFMPAPEGEKVAYEEIDSTLLDVLKRPEYSLFNKAWNKSNMNGLLAKEWTKTAQFTLLVPDDAAMRKAGLDNAGIDGASKEQLDSLLMYHTLSGKVEITAMQTQAGNIQWSTLLLNPLYTEMLNSHGSAVTKEMPYRYRQFLALTPEGQLLVNGIKVGKPAPIAAKDGVIWQVDRVLKPARKNLLQTLEADGRFTLYLEALRLSDSLYETIPELYPYSIGEYWFAKTRLNTTIARMDWGCECIVYEFGKLGRGGRMALFAPTDDAFRRVGLRNVDDLRVLNNRFKPYMNEQYAMVGHAPLDSLLSFHAWGIQRGMLAVGIPPIFYANDFIPAIMDQIVLGDGQSTGVTVELPLRFSKDGNGRVQLQVKGSTAEKATIIDPDIECIQGPIHVVDRLLIRPGFSF